MSSRTWAEAGFRDKVTVLKAVKRSERGEDDGDRKLGRVLDFLRLLWAIDHGLQRVSKRMLAEYGVSGLQRMMIRIVGRFGGISAGELADILHVHPSTLTGALDKLVRSGLMLRETDPEDGRRAQLFLGAKGKGIDAVRTGTVEAAVRRAFSRLSPDQIDAAEEVLRVIARELEEP
jgi:MarR family transcriptional regulator, organic hydroperoxide resistance regulator